MPTIRALGSAEIEAYIPLTDARILVFTDPQVENLTEILEREVAWWERELGKAEGSRDRAIARGNHMAYSDLLRKVRGS